MRRYNIAATPGTLHAFKSKRVVVDLNKADLTSVSAVVMTADEALSGQLERVEATAFGIPVILLNNGAKLPTELFGKVVSVINSQPDNVGLYGRLIDAAAQKYEDQILPPFFGKMESYVRNGNVHFDCPGHQGGAFFRRHPAGRQFADFFGENVFRSDLCNADVAMGDLLIHEGVPRAAQMAAAKIYNADKTYFVLNGTSASNKVVLNALLTPGDLVLFDRNNHKSNHHGALIQAGATPVYLETARNSYGFIGGIDDHCFDEKYLRELIREVAPERADEKRPFRLAVIQLGTYDGTIYNARQVVDRIGRLCDYILFDSARIPPAAPARPRSRGSRHLRDAVRPQAAGRLLADLPDPQEGPSHQGPEALLHPQAPQQRLHDARVHLALLSALRRARRQREDARG